MSDVRISTRTEVVEEPPNTTVNALAGAALTVLTATAVPLSPVVGGGLAGYLEAGEERDGLRAGLLAGGVAAPLLLIALFLFLAPLLRAVGELSEPGTVGVVVPAVTMYVLGLSALGGYLGARIGST